MPRRPFDLKNRPRYGEGVMFDEATGRAVGRRPEIAGPPDGWREDPRPQQPPRNMSVVGAYDRVGRRQAAPTQARRGTLWAGDGQGNGVYQDPTGNRFDRRRVVGDDFEGGIYMHREDRGIDQYDTFQESNAPGTVGSYGQDQLKDGEWEALIPSRPVATEPEGPAFNGGPMGTAAGASQMIDSDGDGIPDGAEMTQTMQSVDVDGNKTTRTAKFRKGQGAGGGAVSMRDRRDPRAFNSIGQRAFNSIGPEKHQQNLDRLTVAAGRNSRDTRRAADRQAILDQRDRPAMRQHKVDLAGAAAKWQAQGVEGAARHGANAEVAKFTLEAQERMRADGVREVPLAGGGQGIVHNGRFYELGAVNPEKPEAIPLYEGGLDENKQGQGRVVGYMNSIDGTMRMLPTNPGAGGGAEYQNTVQGLWSK